MRRHFLTNSKMAGNLLIALIVFAAAILVWSGNPSKATETSYLVTATPFPDIVYLEDLMTLPIENNDHTEVSWLDFTLGETTLSDFNGFVAVISEQGIGNSKIELPDNTLWYTVGFELSEPAYENLSFSSVLVSFVFKYEILIGIEIQLPMVTEENGLWENYSPYNILETYGTPSEIMMYDETWFIYDQLGITIGYRWIQVESHTSASGETIVDYCFPFENIAEIKIKLYIPDEFPPHRLPNYQWFSSSWEELTRSSNEDFFNLLIVEKEDCIQIPLKAWE